MKIILRSETYKEVVKRKDYINLLVDGGKGVERKSKDSKRLYNKDYIDKEYKKIVFNGTIEGGTDIKDMILKKENMKEFVIMFIFNNGKYEPRFDTNEEECIKKDEKLKKRIIKTKREMYEIIEKNMKKKRRSNLEYIIFSYKEGWSSLMYITDDERKCNLNEPDIRYVFKKSNIQQQMDMWFRSESNVINLGMKKFYKMEGLEGETHVEGNYFEMQTERDEESGEWHFKVEFYFKETIQDYFMRKLKKIQLENIKMILKEN